MTPQKAIEVLEKHHRHFTLIGNDESAEATNLGIKALELLEAPTDPRLIYARRLLLGEIED